MSATWLPTFLHVVVAELPPPPPPAAWKLSWADDFQTGPSLNASTWNVKQNETHCSPCELQLYVEDGVRVRDSFLEIATRRQRVAGPHGAPYNFSSGWVDTKSKFSQRLGRFEANCSLPSNAASGIWPAFWLLPDDESQCWPTGGEIDVFEMVGNALVDEIFGSYHWGVACDEDKAPIPGAGYHPPGSVREWQARWHVYGVEWREDRLDYFVDGVRYFTRTNKSVALPTAKMFVIFNQAISPTLFPPPANSTPGAPDAYDGDGATLRVAWVRAYTDVSNARATAKQINAAPVVARAVRSSAKAIQ